MRTDANTTFLGQLFFRTQVYIVLYAILYTPSLIYLQLLQLLKWKS